MDSSNLNNDNNLNQSNIPGIDLDDPLQKGFENKQDNQILSIEEIPPIKPLLINQLLDDTSILVKGFVFNESPSSNPTDIYSLTGVGEHGILLGAGVVNTEEFNGSGEFSRKEIVFVDPTVKDYENLLRGVGSNQEVIILKSDEDGISQISEVLAQRQGIDAVHIVAHGAEGLVRLGSTELSQKTLSQYQSHLMSWEKALSKDADISIYACNLAGDVVGKAFVEQLAKLTNADIAASDDLTGNKHLGGDSELEVQTGEIESKSLDFDNYQGTLATIDTTPVIFIPGFGGSFVKDPGELTLDNTDDAARKNIDDWYVNRGLSPDRLALEPFGQAYYDIVQSLDNVGYTPYDNSLTDAENISAGANLFIAAWDWRLPVAGVNDGNADGIVTGVKDIVGDNIFESGVDYLGYWLQKAKDITGSDVVDIITHSTGGLVARSYIQSDAYGATLSDSFVLPTVEDLVLVGVPNEGTSEVFNFLQDDWSGKPASRALALLVDKSYDLAISGNPITGPDANFVWDTASDKLTLVDSLDANNIIDSDVTKEEFVTNYIRTLNDLLPTFAFYDDDASNPSNYELLTADSNFDGINANELILDLNGNVNGNAFIDSTVSTSVIYGSGVETSGLVQKRVGPAPLLEGGFFKDEILSFTTPLLGRSPNDGEVWYEDLPSINQGDGTLTKESTVGQFLGDPNAKLTINERPNIGHSELVQDVASQEQILGAIGVTGISESDISTGQALSSLGSLFKSIELGIVTTETFEGISFDGVKLFDQLATEYDIDVKDFIKLDAEFSLSINNNEQIVFNATNIDGFIGKGASTETLEDDLGLALSGAAFTFALSSDGTYNFDLDNATIGLVGISDVSLSTPPLNISGNQNGFLINLEGEITIDDYAYLRGSLTFGSQIVNNERTFSLEGQGLTAFIGQKTGEFDIVVNNDADAGNNESNDVGLSITNLAFSIDTGNKEFALNSGTIGLAGIDEVQVEASIVDPIIINTTAGTVQGSFSAELVVSDYVYMSGTLAIDIATVNGVRNIGLEGYDINAFVGQKNGEFFDVDSYEGIINTEYNSTQESDDVGLKIQDLAFEINTGTGNFALNSGTIGLAGIDEVQVEASIVDPIIINTTAGTVQGSFSAELVVSDYVYMSGTLAIDIATVNGVRNIGLEGYDINAFVGQKNGEFFDVDSYEGIINTEYNNTEESDDVGLKIQDLAFTLNTSTKFFSLNSGTIALAGIDEVEVEASIVAPIIIDSMAGSVEGAFSAKLIVSDYVYLSGTLEFASKLTNGVRDFTLNGTEITGFIGQKTGEFDVVVNNDDDLDNDENNDFGLSIANANFSINKVSGLSVNDGVINLTNASQLLISFSDVDLKIGTPDVGFEVLDAGFTLSTISEDPTKGSRKWMGVAANFAEVNLLGLPSEITADVGNLNVLYNIPDSTSTTKLDWKALAEQEGDVYGLDGTQLASLNRGMDLEVMADLTLAIDEYVYVSGSMAFRQGQTVDVNITNPTNPNNTPTKNLSVMTIGADNVNIFVGTGGPYFVDSDEDGDIDKYDVRAEEGATGLVIEDVAFGMMLLKSTNRADRSSYYGIKASADEIRLVGIDPNIFKFELNQLNVEINGGSDAADPKRFVDFTQSALDELDGTADGVTTIITGTDSTIDLDFTQKSIAVSADTAIVDIAGFVQVKGGVAFSKTGAVQTTLSDGTVTTMDILTIGFDNMNAFVGAGPYFIDDNSDTDSDKDDINPNATGLLLENGQLALALFSPTIPTPGASSYYAVSASAESISLPGLNSSGNDSIKIEASGYRIELNSGDLLNRAINFTKFQDNKLTVNTGSGSVDFDFTSKTERVAIENALISIGDYVYLNGGFSFTRQNALSVPLYNSLPDAPAQLIQVDAFALGAGSVDMFVGNGPYFVDENEDGVIDFNDKRNESAVGVAIENANFGLLLMRNTALPTNRFIAMKASADYFGVVGVDDFKLSASDIRVEYNAVIGGPAVIDFSKMNGGAGYDLDLGNGTLNIDYSKGLLRASVSDAELQIGSYVYAKGAFAFEKGDLITGVQLTDGGGTRTLSAINVGVSDLDLFVGANGPAYDEQGQLNPDAVGVSISNANLALALFSETSPLGVVTPGRPTYIALKASADNLGLVGVDNVQANADNVIVELNLATGPNPTPTTPLPVIDFSSFDGEGYEIATGTNTSEILDFTSRRIRASADNALLDLGQFLYVEGNLALDLGSRETVTIKTGIPPILGQLGESVRDEINTALASLDGGLENLRADVRQAFEDAIATILNTVNSQIDVVVDSIFANINAGLEAAQAAVTGEMTEALNESTGSLFSTTIAPLIDQLLSPILSQLPSTALQDLLESVFSPISSLISEAMSGLLEGAISSVVSSLAGSVSSAIQSATATAASQIKLQIRAALTPQIIRLGQSLTALSQTVDNQLAPIFAQLQPLAGLEFGENFATISGLDVDVMAVGVSEANAFVGLPPAEKLNFGGEQRALFDHNQDGTITLGDLATLYSQLTNTPPDLDLSNIELDDKTVVDHQKLLDILDDNNNGFLEISEVSVLFNDEVDITEFDVNSNGRIDAPNFATDNPDAIGLYASNVNLGLGIFDPIVSPSLPTFIAAKLNIDEAGFTDGGAEILDLTAKDIEVQLNLGGTLIPAVGPLLNNAVIDFTASNFSNNPDADPEIPIGFKVETGSTESSPPIYLDFDRETILASVERATVQVSEFVYITGSLAFEKGEVQTVDVTGGLLTDLISENLDDALNYLENLNILPDGGIDTVEELVEAFPALGGQKTELSFMTIGASNVNAFVGMGGPYWKYDENGNVTRDDSYTGAVGLVIEDFDFGMAVMRPTNTIDPSQYFSLKASAELISLEGIEDVTLKAERLLVEVNQSSPTISGLPLFPVVDFANTEQFASEQVALFDANDDGELTLGDLATLYGNLTDPSASLISALGSITTTDATVVDHEMLLDILDTNQNGKLEILEAAVLFDGDEAVVRDADRDGDDKIDPLGFEVNTGNVPVYLSMDSALIRAQGFVELDVSGVVTLYGNVAFELGPEEDVILTDGTTDTVTTMTIGASNVFGFIGWDGPYFLDGNGNKDLDRDIAGNPLPGEVNPNAKGLALNDLNLGAFVGLSTDLLNPAVYFALDFSVDSLETVGLDFLEINATLSTQINFGARLDTENLENSSLAAIDFQASFPNDPDDESDNGFAVNTGDPDYPVILGFDESLLNVEFAGEVIVKPDGQAIAALLGTFFLELDDESFKVLATADLRLGADISSPDNSLLDISALGAFVITADGFAADLDVDLDVNIPVLDLEVGARVLINTTGKEQSITLPDRIINFLEDSNSPLADELLERLDGNTYTIAAYAPDIADVITVNNLLDPDAEGEILYNTSANSYVVAVVRGRANFAGFAEASITGGIAVTNTNFQLYADLGFEIGVQGIDLDFNATGVLDISQAGLYLKTDVELDASLTSLLHVNASGDLLIDTRGATDIFTLDLDGSLTIAGILSLSGGFDIEVGTGGYNTWRVGIDLDGRLGPIILGADGWIQSDGQFSLSAYGGLYFGIPGFSISGQVGGTISLIKSGTNYVYNPDDTYTLTVLVSGDVTLEIIGIPLGAGVTLGGSATFGPDQTILTLYAEGRVRVLFWEVKAGGTIATIAIPGSIFPQLPPQLASVNDGVLSLNVGDKASNRNVGRAITAEDYRLTDYGGGAVLVEAFGRAEVYQGVTRVEADFGDDDDSLTLTAGFGIDVNAQGGSDDDILASAGNGKVTFSGGEGDDILIGGYGNDDLDGDTGNDYLEGQGGTDQIRGGIGNDVIFGTIGDLRNDDIEGDGDLDTLEIRGTSGADNITMEVINEIVEIRDGNGLFNASTFEKISVVPAEGNDTVTLIGNFRSIGIDSVAVDLAENNQFDDTVTVNLLDSPDVLTVVGSETLSPASNQILISSPNPLTSSEVVPTTTANWNQGQETVISGTDSGDRIIFNTLGGADIINVKSLVANVTTVGGADLDTINVGSNASGTTTNPNNNSNGNLNAINGILSVASDSNDVLNIDDSGDNASNIDTTAGNLTSSQLTGLGMGGSINYGSLASLNVALGSNTDHFTVASTNAGVSQTTILGNGGADRFNILSTSSLLTINGGAMADTFRIGSNANGSNTNGTLNGINALLTIDSGTSSSDRDILSLDDTGDNTANTGTLTSTTITGLGLTAGINYANFEDLDISLGSGNNTFTVNNTHNSATGTTETTTINAGAGADVVTINNASDHLTVNAQGGNDTVLVKDTGSDSTVIVNGDVGLDTINIEGNKSLLTVNGNSDNDTINVLSNGYATYINGGSGSDTINIEANTAAITVDAGTDSDTINIGKLNRDVSPINALITVSGGDDLGVTDYLYIDDTGATVGEDNTGIITSNTVSVTGMDVSLQYTRIESLNVLLGGGNDTVTIENTLATTNVSLGAGDDNLTIETADGETNIYGEAGADLVNVKKINRNSLIVGGLGDDVTNVGNNNRKIKDINAILRIEGSGDNDIINIDNELSTSESSGILTSDKIYGLDLGQYIQYDTAEILNIYLGQANDNFTVDSTHTEVTNLYGNDGDDQIRVKTISGVTNIDSESGKDTVTVSSNNNDLFGIQAILNLNGDGSEQDTLIIYNSGAPVGQSGQLSDQQLTGFGMTSPINYQNFETVNLTLGEYDDDLTVFSTIVDTTNVNTGDGADAVKVEAFNGQTYLATDDGGDQITVFDGDGDFAGLNAYLEIDGGQDGDTYQVTIAASNLGRSFIKLWDRGVSGIDELTYLGSSQNDLIQLDTVYIAEEDPNQEFSQDRWLGYGNHGEGLLISHFDGDAQAYQAKDLDNTDSLTDVSVASLQSGENYQVLNYSTIEQVVVFAGDGDDKIVSDDTAQEIDVFGNAGKDQFYVGSILATELVLVEGQEVVVVTEVTHGASFEMNFYGGADDDYFEVNHNRADIQLFGDNGDDLFFVKALLTFSEDEDLIELNNKVATVSGTTGENSESDQKQNDTREVDVDSLVYVENANVSIDGGAGFDSVAIVGTVLSDTFYVFTEEENGETIQRIYGAGVKLKELLNIERIQLVTGRGDDRVYVYGVDLGNIGDLVINTGAGSDTIYVGGEELTINLNFPSRSRTEYATVNGYEGAGEVEIDYGLGIELTDNLDRVVPFNINEPANTQRKIIQASTNLDAIASPVLIQDTDGLIDTIVFNNQTGSTNLTFDAATLYKKGINTDLTKVIYPSSSTNTTTTDLIAQLSSLSEVGSAAVKEIINDYLRNQIVFNDRYYDRELINRLLALTGNETETITIPSEVSYAVFQTLLDNNGNLVTAREQLSLFLAGTGYTANYIESNHPDPSRSDKLYELVSITNSQGQKLAFEAQYRELIKDDIVYKDIIGVSLITANPIELEVQAGYIQSVEIIKNETWHTLYKQDHAPLIYFEAEKVNSQTGVLQPKFEEITINLNSNNANNLLLDNESYLGKTYVEGGQANDVFEIKSIAGQTFVHGNSGDDTFEVGDGTVNQVNNNLFLIGDAGEDQVNVNSNALDTESEITLEKSTVVHQFEQDKLSKITNALEFANITDAENQAMGQLLQQDSIVYVQEILAKLNLNDLKAIAIQASNEIGENISDSLELAKTDFAQGIIQLIAEQKGLINTFVKTSLVDYFNAREGEANAQTAYDQLIVQRDNNVDAVNIIVDSIKNSISQQSNLIFGGLFGQDVKASYTVLSDIDAGDILDGYNATNQTLTLSVDIKEVKVTTTYVFGFPITTTEEQTFTDTFTLDVNQDSTLKTAVDNIVSLEASAKQKQEEIGRLQAEKASAKSLLSDYFNDSQIDAYYNEAARTDDPSNTAVIWIESDLYGSGVKTVLTTIETEINNSANVTKNLLDQAISAANTLETTTNNLGSAIAALQTKLTALNSNLNTEVTNTNSWDNWVGIERLQILKDVLFTEEKATLVEAGNLWNNLPTVSKFNNVVNWNEAITLYNSDSNFIKVVNSYKDAQELAENFTNYRDDKYDDFRAVYRDILKFETAKNYLEDGFDFEAFKAEYENNLSQINAVLSVLDDLRLEAKYSSQLKSLEYDQEELENIVNSNAAIVNFFNNLKTEAETKFTNVNNSLSSAYTIVFNWFFFRTLSFTVTFDYSNDPQYLQALDSKQTATTNYQNALEASQTAIADKAELDAIITDLQTKLGELPDGSTLENLNFVLSQQYKFLRNLSQVAIQVLSESRKDQAAEGFDDVSSLISQVQHYLNNYEVNDQIAPENVKTQTFASNNGGSSVIAQIRETESWEVLSLTGLNNGGIHTDFNTVEKLTVYTGSNNDVVKVYDSLGQANSEVSVITGQGNDEIILSNQENPIDPISTHELSVDDFLGDVRIDAGVGNNQLMINDEGDPTGDTIFQQYSDEYIQITGMAAGEIYYVANGGNFSNGLDIITSSGDDDITINALHGSDHTRLYARSGDDDITVNSFVVNPLASLTIYGETGDDVIDASQSPVAVTVYGQEGKDTAYGSNLNDTLFGNEQDDLIIGNLGDDVIDAGAGNDIVIGDRGSVKDLLGNELTQRHLPQALVVSSLVGNSSTNDIITTGEGNDVIFGGSGDDTIDSGSSLGDRANDVVVGDHGSATFDNNSNLTSITTTVVGGEGKDNITVGEGDDIVLGGSGNDVITSSSGNNVILGDNGSISLNNNQIQTVTSTDTAQGGNDSITTGNGDDVVIGGIGIDNINVNNGNNIVIGDSGSIAYNGTDGNATTADTIQSLNETNGGVDIIATGSGNDMVIGGDAGDVINAGDGDNLVIGDNGIIELHSANSTTSAVKKQMMVAMTKSPQA
ncbi:DUF4347 domain-containing protein [Richelia sinica]|nr:DUF4347 domain-containing protein [Richelia sinica]